MTRTANLINIRITNFGVQQIMDEIKNKFVGKWKLDRSERFEDFLRECGKLTWFRFEIPSSAILHQYKCWLILPVQCNIRRFEMKSIYLENCKITTLTTSPCCVQCNHKKATRNEFNRIPNRKCIKYIGIMMQSSKVEC